MTSNAPLQRLDRRLTTCHLCRTPRIDDGVDGLCRDCRESTDRRLVNGLAPRPASLSPEEAEIRRQRIVVIRQRVRREMAERGILPAGWDKKPIPHCCRDKSTRKPVRQLVYEPDADQVEADMFARFDGVRRSFVESVTRRRSSGQLKIDAIQRQIFCQADPAFAASTAGEAVAS